METTGADATRARVAGLDWWHTIEVAPGVVTPGGWDLRGTAERLPWPASLAGMRCLDIGTMDGFWAFELERRGAGKVVASDVLDAKTAMARENGRTKSVSATIVAGGALTSARPPMLAAKCWYTARLTMQARTIEMLAAAKAG